MKTKIFKKPLSLIFAITILIGCNSEEELPPDKLIGEWEVYSITDEGGETIVWDDLTNSLIELIPEYACMEFTATATEQIVSTKYVFVDVNSRGCLSPAISVYTWQISPETGFYEFTIQQDEPESCSVSSGSILIEVLLALLILTSTTTYLLATRIDSRLLFQVTLDENAEHNGSLNSDRLALVNDPVDQRWDDIAIFGEPSLLVISAQ